MWLSNPTTGNIFKGKYSSKEYMHPNIHGSAVLWYPKYGSSLNIHGQMNRKRRCAIYIQENITQPSERIKWHCIYIDGPGDYHTKWGKSDKGRQLYLK